MAPLTTAFETMVMSIPAALAGFRRDSLGVHGHKNQAPKTNVTQVRVVGGLAIAAASISLLAVSVALFWFFRMRRNFRHQ
jgi:hypothetical protein